jgi:hypothetical protein
MLAQKQAVVISRHWHSPDILVVVSDESIEIKCALSDFLTALATEIKHPATTMTRDSLRANIESAAKAVLAKIKEASAYV